MSVKILTPERYTEWHDSIIQAVVSGKVKAETASNSVGHSYVAGYITEEQRQSLILELHQYQDGGFIKAGYIIITANKNQELTDYTRSQELLAFMMFINPTGLGLKAKAILAKILEANDGYDSTDVLIDIMEAMEEFASPKNLVFGCKDGAWGFWHEDNF